MAAPAANRSAPSPTGDSARLAPIVAFLATAALIGIAGLFPGAGLWGLSAWAYLAWPIRLAMAAVLLGGLIASLLFSSRWTDREADIPSAASLPTVAVTFGAALGAGLLFYFLRGQTHFLGDGYQNLARLADGLVLVKMTEPVEEYAHLAARNLIGGAPTTAALASYQWLSIVSGILLTALTVLFSRQLFRRTADRVIFCLGILTGGYMLLFFGYVENYSIFVLAVGAFTLTGIAVARERIKPVWAVLPAVLAIACHILGLLLIPALVYLLLRQTRLGRSLGRTSLKTRLLLVLLLGVGGAILFELLRSSDLFFRLAFLPVVADNFTVDSYTLFSLSHLRDFAVLLLTLAPSLIVAIVLLNRTVRRSLWQNPAVRFLVLCAGASLFGVFMLDPKLGMARDWDLFSFAALPVVALITLTLLEKSIAAASRRVAVILALTLSTTVLGTRVARQVVPTAGIAYASHLIDLDPLRNRSAYMAMMLYYRDRGETAAADSVTQLWNARYPARLMVQSARELRREGKLAQAADMNQRAMRIDPRDFNAYANLGDCLLAMRQYDSAQTVLEIADGLNPNSYAVLNNLGSALFYHRDFDRAARAWTRAIRLDTMQYQPLFNLMRLYQVTGDRANYQEFVRRLAERNDVPLTVVRELTELYLSQRNFAAAASLIRRNLPRGLDTAYVMEALQKYPELKDAFK